MWILSSVNKAQLNVMLGLNLARVGLGLKCDHGNLCEAFPDSLSNLLWTRILDHLKEEVKCCVLWLIPFLECFRWEKVRGVIVASKIQY